MNKEYLPIGTVVQLKNSTARVMIGGYLPMTDKSGKKVWDYSGFRFPLGFIRVDDVYCFDHEQVETICCYGYRDLECDEFMKELAVREPELRERAMKGK